MKRSGGLVAAVIFLGLFGSEAQAADPTVTISNTDNSTAGQVTATGTYTEPAGWTVLEIKIEARPTGGAAGRGSVANAVLDTTGKTFSGTPTGLPTGNYDVQAVMRASDGRNTRYFYSAVKTGIAVR
jgi:hypothetical protein